MEWNFNDGGRSNYFKGTAGDCVTRAIAIATGIDYLEIYNQLKKLAGKSCRNGTPKKTSRQLLEKLGWKRVATMKIGEGCKMHLTEDEIPDGTVIIQLSKHLVCVKDKIIQDTYNSSIKEYYDVDGNLVINDKRCVYGYWIQNN